MAGTGVARMGKMMDVALSLDSAYLSRDRLYHCYLQSSASNPTAVHPLYNPKRQATDCHIAISPIEKFERHADESRQLQITT